MTRPSDAAMARAAAARDRLVQTLGSHPAVSLIDIGLFGPASNEVFVRVHLRARIVPPPIPGAVDGVPVFVLRGDYRLES